MIGLVLASVVLSLSPTLTLCTDSGCTTVPSVVVQLSPLTANGRPAYEITYDLATGRVEAYEQVISRDGFE